MIHLLKRRIIILALTFSALFLLSNSDVQATATDFTLKNLAGEDVSLSDFTGSQNVLVVFGTTWCPYCVSEIDTLNQLQSELGDKIKVLGVYVQEKMNKVQQFTQKKGVQYEVLLDTEGAVAQAYGVRGIPAAFFVDKNGTVLYSETGTLDVPKVTHLAQE